MKRGRHTWSGRLATEACKCDNFDLDRILGNATLHRTEFAGYTGCGAYNGING